MNAVAEVKKTFQKGIIERGEALLAKKEAERAAALASVEPYTPDWLPSKRFRKAVLFNPNNPKHAIRYESGEKIEVEDYIVLTHPIYRRDDEKIYSYFRETGRYPKSIYAVGGPLPSYEDLKEEPVTLDDLLIKKLVLVLDASKQSLKAANADPRKIVAATMDNLRKLQTLDGKFPQPLTTKSLWGLLGDFVEIAHPTTVASREMLLYEMLPLIGVLMGDAYYLPYGSDKHFASIFSLAIGRTTDGKGQGWHCCEDAVRLVDPEWFQRNLHSNPASGEGLIRMLGENTIKMEGSHKKRVAIFNSEMVTTFNAQNRKDSSLSGALRKAYDGDRQENYRSDKKKSVTADNYLLGFCGTITPKELQDVMPMMDWSNGAQNRFLWGLAFRDKTLSHSTKHPDFRKWAERVKKLVELNIGVQPTAIDYSPEGQQSFNDWYQSLPEHDDSILAESQARAAANCARVAVLYAQLDERRLSGWQVQVEPRHVEAAVEIVNRSRQSVEWYLAQQMGSTKKASYEEIQKLKQALVKKLREGGNAELTTSQISELFTHKTREERDEICLAAGFKPSTIKTRGKTTVVWSN